MHFTDDSLLPENQAPLMITAAPYEPMWMPGDCTPERCGDVRRHLDMVQYTVATTGP